MNSRAKGRRAESAFALLLADRDYDVTDTTAGKSCCDLVAEKDGITWAFEVKDRAICDWKRFLAQAHENATGRKRWALAVHLPGYRSWLVLRQGCDPQVWHE